MPSRWNDRTCQLELLSWLRRPDVCGYEAGHLSRAPPLGTQPPPLWGDEDYVRGVVRGTDHGFHRHPPGEVAVEAFATPQAFVDFFRANYGPMVAAYRAIADDPGGANRRAGRTRQPR